MAHPVSHRIRAAGILTAALLATGFLAACDASSYSLSIPNFMSDTAPPSPPEQVGDPKLRVTYNYRGDQESMQASQKAAAFCAQYQSRAHILHSDDELDGTTTAEFECLPGIPAAAAPPLAAHSMTYSYRNDQELLNATHNAQSQCPPSDNPVTSTISIDSNGNRTVTFQCVRG
jgi:hypothetical protein